MITKSEVEKLLNSHENVVKEHPFGDETSVYKVDDKMFALMTNDKNPIRLSLRCDPKLSSVLREKYVEVMPGYHLNKKQWNTIVLSGQLKIDEIRGIITHSYDLAVKEN